MTKPKYCLCPYPQYKEGNCVYCGDPVWEVANDHEIERSRVTFTRAGTCVCKISKPAPEGYCSKCRRELPSAKSESIEDSGINESLIKSSSMNEQSKEDADSQSGWYPDPVTGELKYFDGNKWLDIPPPETKSQRSRKAPREEEVSVERNKSRKVEPVIQLQNDPAGDRYGFIGSYSVCGNCGSSNKNSTVCTSCGHNFKATESNFHSTNSFQNGKENYISGDAGPKKRTLKFALFFGIALAVIFVGAQIRGASTTQPPASTDTSGEGRWISKCRTVLVPNPNYPGNQVPISERIGIPQNFSQQQCTDVYVRD